MILKVWIPFYSMTYSYHYCKNLTQLIIIDNVFLVSSMYS